VATLISPLRERNFRWMWLGQTVSVMGDRILPVALAIAVLDAGGGVSGLSAVLAARAFALTVVVLPAGILADRLNRTHVMIGADVLRLGALVGLAFAVPVGVPVAAALAFVVGVGEGLFTPAFSAVIPQLLPDREIQSGNALVSLSARTAMLVGPAVGGALVAGGGARVAFLVDGFTYLVSVVSLLAVRLERRVRSTGRITVGETLAGLREIRRRRWITAVIVMSSVHMVVASAAWSLLLPVVSRDRLGGTASYSTLLVLFGVGALGGALLGGRWRPARPGLVGLLALYPFGAMLLGMAWSDSVVVIAALSVLAGMGLELFGIIWITALQRDVPGDTLARVTSFDYFISGLLYPFGLAVMGPVTERAGTTAVLVFGAVTLAVTAALPLLVPGGARFATPPAERSALADTP
jgi:MFS family permease